MSNMLDAFIKLAEAAGKIGRVTSAHLYETGFICIDIVLTDGKCFSLSYRAMQQEEPDNGTVPTNP
jgi:hypothetical protein